MLKLKRLSGPEIIKIFEQFGFAVASQHGSHIKMRRVMADGSRQTLIVSNHKKMKIGAVDGVFKQALQYISEPELREHFYTEQ